MYYECSICNEYVKGRHGRPYGVGRWKEHVQHNARHLQCLKKKEQEEVLSLKAKGNRTKLEQLFLDSQKKKPTKIIGYFSKLPSKQREALNLAIPDDEIALNSRMNSHTEVTTAGATAAVAAAKSKLVFCEGVLSRFTQKPFQLTLSLYAKYATIDTSSKYTMDMVGALSQVFSRNHNSDNCIEHTVRRLGKIQSCSACWEFW